MKIAGKEGEEDIEQERKGGKEEDRMERKI